MECDLLKTLDPASLEIIQHLFNEWFAGTEIEAEALKARVSMIYKKGPS